MPWDDFSEIRTDVIDRLGESISDTAGDFYATVGRQIDRAYHDLCNYHPWLFLRAEPPGVVRTVAPITAGTLAVTNGSTTITFSSAPAASVATLELIVTGWNEVYRIASHTAGATTATLDSAFNGTTNAAASYTVFQREYNLATNARHLIALVISEGSVVVPQRDEAWLREKYPDPPFAQWPPQYFTRIGENRIRLCGYPDRTRRIEVAYTIIPVDISGAGVTILVPRNWRYVIGDGALYLSLLARNDDRADAAGILYAGSREKMVEDDLGKRAALGQAGVRHSGDYR